MANSSRPRLALIAGPTASGKSAAAMAMAEREGGIVINADASQVYRDLRILSARPSAEDEARVPHRLFGYRDGADPCSAADWAEDAKAAIAATVAEGRLPILVGGTGLYFRALLQGLAPIPEIDPIVRRAVRTLDAAAAQAALAREDPAMAARLHANDTSRLQRALEVVRSTGRSLAEWQAERDGGIARHHRIEQTLLLPPVSELYPRCDARVDQMIADGAVEEVRGLLARGLARTLPVMRAIGVDSLRSYLSGQSLIEEAIDVTKKLTRNYAKRQRTWFVNQTIFY